MGMSLDDILRRLAEVPEAERTEAIDLALKATAKKRWVPNPGPQTDAYFSEADELFYGGQAGGGKTDLACGLAVEEHDQALILRHTSKEARGIIDRMAEIMGTRDGLNQQSGSWHIGDGRSVEFGGCEHEDDKQKYKGRPHDLIVFDEVSDFTKTQYVFIQAWNRSTKPGQRCRVLATGNPPTKPEGLWVLERWAAWLDPTHPNPARPGELRWFTTGENGQEIEVDGPGPHFIGGEMVRARSRTFIPATLADNPDLAATNYGAVMAALPEDLRRAYRDGEFLVSLQDDAMQAIPTSWVKAAQARWTPQPPEGVPMCAMGIDVAQGGPDRSTLAPRFDGWYPMPHIYPGKETADGRALAGLVIKHRRDSAVCVVDLGGGWGGECYGHLKENGIDSYGYMGVKTSHHCTNDAAKIRFLNVRTEAYWRFREALNPDQDGGSIIALPPSNELVADLCTPKYRIKGQGSSAVITLESKEDVKKTLGRSPDIGDAVVMAWYKGLTHANMIGGKWTPKKVYPTTAITKRGSTRR